jgi:hypothetical protein
MNLIDFVNGIRDGNDNKKSGGGNRVASRRCAEGIEQDRAAMAAPLVARDMAAHENLQGKNETLASCVDSTRMGMEISRHEVLTRTCEISSRGSHFIP